MNAIFDDVMSMFTWWQFRNSPMGQALCQTTCPQRKNAATKR